MKQGLNLGLTLALLVAFAGPGMAQPKAGESEMMRRGTGGVSMAGLTRMMTGKVTQVNDAARTFTVETKGQAVTFNAADLKIPPKLGQVVEITYTGPPGGGELPKAVTVNPTRSNAY